MVEFNRLGKKNGNVSVVNGCLIYIYIYIGLSILN